jgi:Rrf2 family protein
MLSRTSEHAIRAVLYLAGRRGEGPVPVDAIAEALDAPRNYLSKTLYALAKAGVVDSVRGVRGGFTLAVPPEALAVADVVAVFDAPRDSGMCLLGGRPCDHRAPCDAHDRWVAMSDAARAPLDTTTIADLLGRPAAARPARAASRRPARRS